MFTRALRIWAMTIALGVATGAAAQGAPPSSRLALVVGEAAYSGDALPTASADAALIARSLAGNGFDVTELHDLGTADLAQQYQGFVAKVAAAPPGAAVTVYFAGLGVNVGCDDYLLPVDAQIATEADVPRIALSMTRVMRDLAQIPVAVAPGHARRRAARPGQRQRRRLPARLDPARPADGHDLRPVGRNP